MAMTKFSLALSNGREHPVGQELLNQGQIGNVLAAMPKLTDLSIQGHDLGMIGAIPSSWYCRVDGTKNEGKKLWRKAKFPDLRSAEFAYGLVSRDEIRGFLCHHGTTLRHFRLLFCSLGDDMPSWFNAVQDIFKVAGNGKRSGFALPF
ncbi:hypothetical protein CDV31_000826 [Fusarium ambrosium]|uniref:Uncharacterized protein n=1 Tax=Fusarium ambrosium TaxID=131363 RepID=A0A428V1D1_9HYPO|nr:hypothetical protein CDV31_000826 [Fusarium ambrosium]